MKQRNQKLKQDNEGDSLCPLDPQNCVWSRRTDKGFKPKYNRIEKKKDSYYYCLFPGTGCIKKDFS